MTSSTWYGVLLGQVAGTRDCVGTFCWKTCGFFQLEALHCTVGRGRTMCKTFSQPLCSTLSGLGRSRAQLCERKKHQEHIFYQREGMYLLIKAMQATSSTPGT